MDLLDALDGAQIPYRNGSAEGEIWLCCPFCIEEGEPELDTRFRLGVNVISGTMGCFNCKKGSRSIRYTFSELQRALDLGQLEAAAKGTKKSKNIKGDVTLPKDYTPLWKVKRDDDWGWKAYRYLRRRGVPRWQMRRLEIGYSMVGYYAYRVVIPIMYKGKLYGIVGRDFTGKSKLTYKNSLGQKALFGIPKRKAKRAILLEGCLDAMAVARACRALAGFDAVAVLGSSLTEFQIKQLKGYKEIILWPDPDKPGTLGFLKMAKPLEGKFKLSMVEPKLNDGRDPDELAVVTIRKRVKARKRIKDLELTTARWKMKFKNEED